MRNPQGAPGGVQARSPKERLEFSNARIGLATALICLYTALRPAPPSCGSALAELGGPAAPVPVAGPTEPDPPVGPEPQGPPAPGRVVLVGEPTGFEGVFAEPPMARLQVDLDLPASVSPVLLTALSCVHERDTDLIWRNTPCQSLTARPIPSMLTYELDTACLIEKEAGGSVFRAYELQMKVVDPNHGHDLASVPAQRFVVPFRPNLTVLHEDWSYGVHESYGSYQASSEGLEVEWFAPDGEFCYISIPQLLRFPKGFMIEARYMLTDLGGGACGFDIAVRRPKGVVGFGNEALSFMIPDRGGNRYAIKRRSEPEEPESVFLSNEMQALCTDGSRPNIVRIEAVVRSDEGLVDYRILVATGSGGGAFNRVFERAIRSELLLAGVQLQLRVWGTARVLLRDLQVVEPLAAS